MKTKILHFILFIACIGIKSAYGQCTFDLGNDISYCQGQSFSQTLTAPSNQTSYLWSTGATSQSITITTEGTYSCAVTLLSNDLITNGSFSSGSSGFSSSYIVGTGGSWGPLSSEGQYLVTNNASSAHNNFPNFGDHTGGGNMMVVNGSGSPGTSVWCQSVTVTPNTNYNFSTWVATCVASSSTELSDLQFSINGTLLGTAFSPPMASGQWTQFNATWNSGSNTSASICIVNQNTAISGNDFALDDIFFQQICTASDEIIVTENPSPTVSFTGLPSPLTCTVQSVSLNPSASPNVTYNWLGPGISGNTTAASVMANAPGVYTVVVTNTNNCTANATTTVSASSSFPIVDAGPATQTIACQGLSTALAPTQEQVNYQYSWSGPNGFSSSLFSPGSVNISGTYVLTATDLSTGCEKKDSVLITVLPDPNAAFTANPVSGNPPLEVNFTNGSAYASTYIWNFGVTSTTVSTQHPEYIYLSEGTYTVTLIAGNGTIACNDTAISVITVMPNSALIIPNIFSPNGDDINDVFHIHAVAIKELEVDIFNRWGQKVKSFNALTSDWDGKDCSEGTYYYIVKGQTSESVLIDEKGTVQLVK